MQQSWRDWDQLWNFREMVCWSDLVVACSRSWLLTERRNICTLEFWYGVGGNESHGLWFDGSGSGYWSTYLEKTPNMCVLKFTQLQLWLNWSPVDAYFVVRLVQRFDQKQPHLRVRLMTVSRWRRVCSKKSSDCYHIQTKWLLSKFDKDSWERY